MSVTIYHNPKCVRRSFPTPLYLLHRQPLPALLSAPVPYGALPSPSLGSYLRHPWRRPWSRRSRAALKLLEDRALKPRVIEYLGTPPSETELKHLLRLLNLPARELLRKKELEYKLAGLDNPATTDAQIIRAMNKFPKLIERPIVEKGKKTALGRPPGNVLKIL